MYCKTRENWPFSGSFFGNRVILTFGGYLLKIAFKDSQGTVKNFMANSGCSKERATPKKRDGTNRTGGSTILKLLWALNALYFLEFGNLQPYETWEFRICSESAFGVFPDLIRIWFRKC